MPSSTAMSARSRRSARPTTRPSWCASPPPRRATAGSPTARCGRRTATDGLRLAEPERLGAFPRRLGRREADVTQLALPETRELRRRAPPPPPRGERAADARGNAFVLPALAPQPRRRGLMWHTDHGEAPNLHKE